MSKIMDMKLNSHEPTVTKIEDIIDIQKANGNINVRQVAFKVPIEIDGKISTTMTKSLESGLSKTKSERLTKKGKKIRIRTKRIKDSMSDAISWPSDSDITVLRMKLRPTTDGKDEVGKIILGDGLHQPDSSSMINLATLILQSQRPSKQSINNLEEYLLPLTSWEHAVEVKSNKDEENKNEICNVEYNNKMNKLEATCSHYDEFDIRNSTLCNSNTKSKVARFLRLYFCPCCSCLYKIEKMQDEPSTYFTKHQGNVKNV